MTSQDDIAWTKATGGEEVKENVTAVFTEKRLVRSLGLFTGKQTRRAWLVTAC